MSRMRLLFRDAWTIARPYWFSEDRWAGRGLLGSERYAVGSHA